ncbi:tetratricopeptide repeat protein [Acidithiobacillus sp. IBUN Pt1247-S3]|uniref:tetratricopeptide repeat protein n=1 Tax=Acidithiobacillus sp. IBUN Pt1247-S3 TaxID=3166642 RepID=UPI0034E486ED
MRAFIARLIFLVILVAIVLFGIVAIQHPDTWQHDWKVVRSFFVRHWEGLQGQVPNHEEAVAAKTSTQSKVAPPIAVTPTMPTISVAPVYLPPPARPQSRLNDRQLTLLMAARRAFWIGDFPVAIGDYRALITADPDQAELYGELGNVLWRSGQRIAAATAYAHAGHLLLAQGNYSQAAALIPILTRLDPEAAEHLQEGLAR